MKHPQLTLEIISVGPITHASPVPITGYGPDGEQIDVGGQIRNIKVRRDGDSQFSIQIDADGGIIITDYAGINYTTAMGGLMRLYPSRPWE